MQNHVNPSVRYVCPLLLQMKARVTLNHRCNFMQFFFFFFLSFLHVNGNLAVLYYLNVVCFAVMADVSLVVKSLCP